MRSEMIIALKIIIMEQTPDVNGEHHRFNFAENRFEKLNR